MSSANADMLRETSVVVKAGERALILGAPGTGKTQLFRALAGLWPWGAGRIARPKGEQIFYLPRGTPYLPRGTLREVLAYPLKAESFSTDAFTRALFRLGLERLAPLLDETHRWDRELSQDEQLCLVFARILMQMPPWVLIDGTFGVAGRRRARVGHRRLQQRASSTSASSISAVPARRMRCSRPSCISSRPARTRAGALDLKERGTRR